ncbi:MAG: hypothetical protein P1U56_25910 [Saprospiraceae bacterium]|nr:hypothetical protein [Saprospiraceae bacterium]
MSDIYIQPLGNEPSLLDSSQNSVQSISLYSDNANSRLISDDYYVAQEVRVSRSGSYLFRLKLAIDSPIGLKFYPYNKDSKTYNPGDLNNLEVKNGDKILQLVRFFTTEAEYNCVSENYRNFRIRFGTAENETALFRSKGIPTGGYYKVNKSRQRSNIFIPTTLVIS